jgi:hypothetical protein
MLKDLSSGLRHSPQNYRHSQVTKNSSKAWTYVCLVNECIDNSSRVLSDWNPTEVRAGYTGLASRCRTKYEHVTNRVGTPLGGLTKFRLDTRSDNDLDDRSL